MIETWRKEREEKLLQDMGWLSLDGLIWLQSGINQIGKGALVDLNYESIPGFVLELDCRDSSVVLLSKNDVLISDLQSGQEIELEKDLFQIAGITFMVIERIGKYALRVWNPKNARRLAFEGCQWFEEDEEFRVQAEVEEVDTEIVLPGKLGVDSVEKAAFRVHYYIKGQRYSLHALSAGEKSLFLPFKDLSNGISTYSPGRYLSADLEGYSALLDFNRSYSPPCAFTPYATCSFPPKENHLPIEIHAGEKYPFRSKDI
jgi:uncharacterized protein (DUF1684 family)